MPCGDATNFSVALSALQELGVEYKCVHNSPARIKFLRKKFPILAEKSVFFSDYIYAKNNFLPVVDLVYSPRFLQYLNVEDNLRILNNWSFTHAKFLIASTFSNVSPNLNFVEVNKGTAVAIDFLRDPYHFPQPLQTWTYVDASLHEKKAGGEKIDEKPFFPALDSNESSIHTYGEEADSPKPNVIPLLALWDFQNIRDAVNPGKRKTFKIIVLTQRRHKSLHRLLVSLENSHYDGADVELHIRIDSMETTMSGMYLHYFFIRKVSGGYRMFAFVSGYN